MSAEQDLVKAARSLDQSGPETVASKLQRLWSALVATTPTAHAHTTHARFHAAEEVALRWLLKNMHATAAAKASPEVETLRRWPLTWRILATLFRRIPLFSLAKSLADRRFVAILQQTARDLATPSAKLSKTDAKRKQTPEAIFELDALSTPQTCLASAACLFEALGELLARLASSASASLSASASTSPYNHIGAEHIKSLFSVAAVDALVLLQPLLRVCKLAVTLSADDTADTADTTRSTGMLDNAAYPQDTWIATLAMLWDFHMQGPTDAFDVASTLSGDGLVMIGHLAARTAQASHADRVWLAGLRRFFTNSLVLPARSAFLNRGDLQALSAATATSAALFTTPHDAADVELLLTTLLSLALRAPRPGGASASASSKDNERWLQAVFEQVRVAAMASKAVAAAGTEQQALLLQRLLTQAAASGIAPSVASLRQVCQQCVSFGPAEADAHAQRRATANWSVLAAVAQCDTDVFLASDDTLLLDTVLQHVSTAPGLVADLVADFLVSLATGYAAGRNLPGFVARWYSGMAGLGARISDVDVARTAWFDTRLRTAVADMLGAALTKEQFLALVAQVEGLSPPHDSSTAHTVAQLVVFEAITAGIRHEDIEDAVHTRMLDHVLAAGLVSSPSSSSSSSPELAPAILAGQWRVIRHTLQWVSFAEAERVWSSVKKPLRRMAKAKDGLLRQDRYEAFVCCFTLWMNLKLGGAVEAEAREMTWALFRSLHDDMAALVTTKDEQVALIARAVQSGTIASFHDKRACLDAYLAWMLVGSSRFIDEMVTSADEPSAFLKQLVAWTPERGPAGVFQGIAAAITAAITSNFTTYQNHAVTTAAVDSNVKCLEQSLAQTDGDLCDAIAGLLKTPAHLLQRVHRERIVSCLTPARPLSPRAEAFSVDVYTAILDLLVAVSQERAFGPDLDVDRLVFLGEALDAVLSSAGAAADQSYVVFHRYAQVATAYFKSAGSKKETAIPASVPVSVRAALLGAKLQSTLPAAQAEDAKEALSVLLLEQLLAYLGLEQPAKKKDKGKPSKKKSKKDAGDGSASTAMSVEPLPVGLRLAVEAAMASDIQPFLVKQAPFANAMAALKAQSDAARTRSPKVSWTWAAFLARYARGQDGHVPRQVRFPGLFPEAAAPVPADSTLGLLELHGVLLRNYLDSATADADQEAILSYIGDIIAALAGSHDGGSSDAGPAVSVGQLLAVQYLLARLLSTPGGATTKTADGSYYLAIFHSRLSQKLPHARTTTECTLLARTLHTLLADDKAAAAMGQWNVDSAMSSAALLVGTDSTDTGGVRASAAAFDGACLLVEAVLKRHRVRLEGRFHLLVGTLQALLARLAAGHQDELKQKQTKQTATSVAATTTGWAVQAKRFARLLELVCEPSTAAVTLMSSSSRKGATGAPAPLHSATDAAKRSAGHHMYLVLMTYIKLQIDGAVLSRCVREALEPGLYSILTITPDETRRVLNDAVDASGRALFKDLYRKWLQFGKWKGV